MVIQRIINYFRRRKYLSNSDKFCKYLIDSGVRIGRGTCFRPRTTEIDLTRPSLISIGSDCYFNDYFCVLTHDWVTQVFINSGKEFLPSSGRVSIGNNVSTGRNVTILKGVSIGDNVFIGANSVVTRDIPSNSIAAGIPCKVLMSLDEYYQRRQDECIGEALIYAQSIQQRFGRKPLVTDFWEEFPLFVDGDKIDDYPEIAEIIKRQLGKTYQDYIKSHKAKFHNFTEFLQAAGVQ